MELERINENLTPFYSKLLNRKLLSQQRTLKTHTFFHTDTKTHFTVIMLDFVLSLTLFVGVGGRHFKRP